jgi:hypothetical protein
MQTSRKTFEIEEALGWELYKMNLAEALFDRTATDAGCPQEITASVYTGEVQGVPPGLCLFLEGVCQDCSLGIASRENHV